MFYINISQNVFYVLVLLIVLLLLISLMIFISSIYNTKCKHDSLREFYKSDKLYAYRDIQKLYNRILKDSDIKSENKGKLINKVFKIIKLINQFRGSG